MTSTAPQRPASFFDIATGQSRTGQAAARIRGWLIDNLADTARNDPVWVFEDTPAATPMRLNLIDHVAGQRAELRIGNGKTIGTLLIEADPSGWLAITISTGTGAAFAAFADRPYEEVELWPPGADTSHGEPPGRMGKRLNWVSLSVDGWPALAGLTPHAFLNLSAADG